MSGQWVYAEGATVELPVTRWRIVGVPGLPDRLQILLLVDTVAPIVTDTVERAARENGIELVRLEDEDE